MVIQRRNQAISRNVVTAYQERIEHESIADILVPAQSKDLEGNYRRASGRRRDRTKRKLAQGAFVMAMGL
jgi:hypothetical protein